MEHKASQPDASSTNGTATRPIRSYYFLCKRFWFTLARLELPFSSLTASISLFRQYVCQLKLCASIFDPHAWKCALIILPFISLLQKALCSQNNSASITTSCRNNLCARHYCQILPVSLKSSFLFSGMISFENNSLLHLELISNCLLFQTILKSNELYENLFISFYLIQRWDLTRKAICIFTCNENALYCMTGLK